MLSKRGLQIALFLLPAFYILHNYNQVFGFIDVMQIVIALLLFYIPLLFCYFLMTRSGISREKTELILFILTFFVLFFGAFQKFFSHIPFLSIVSNFFAFTIVCVVAVLLLTRRVLKLRDINPNFSRALGLIVVILFIIEISTFLTYNAFTQKTNNLIYPYKPLSDNYMPSGIPDSSKPDLYFFVFDAYTNNATLKTVWNFDNSEITDWLSGRGFHIGDNTHSNYNFTAFSVSSTFNMNFIDPAKGNNAGSARNVLQANKSLSNNETFSILRKENYTIHFLAPFSNSIKDNGLGAFFDYLSAGQITRQTFPGCLHNSTFFSSIKTLLHSGINEDEYYEPLKSKYENILKTVEKIKATADSSKNRKSQFVYGHIMVPHEPPMFNSKGKFISPEEAKTATPYNTYVDQIRFANTLIRDLVSYIQNHNKPNTVIIIQGDHGFGFYRTDSIPVFAFKNFNAIYFPDKIYSHLYEGMSPINDFRIIFDKYFGQHYSLLKDSSIIVRE